MSLISAFLHRVSFFVITLNRLGDFQTKITIVFSSLCLARLRWLLVSYSWQQIRNNRFKIPTHQRWPSTIVIFLINTAFWLNLFNSPLLLQNILLCIIRLKSQINKILFIIVIITLFTIVLLLRFSLFTIVANLIIPRTTSSFKTIKFINLINKVLILQST